MGQLGPATDQLLAEVLIDPGRWLRPRDGDWDSTCAATTDSALLLGLIHPPPCPIITLFSPLCSPSHPLLCPVQLFPASLQPSKLAYLVSLHRAAGKHGQFSAGMLAVCTARACFTCSLPAQQPSMIGLLIHDIWNIDPTWKFFTYFKCSLGVLGPCSCSSDRQIYTIWCVCDTKKGHLYAKSLSD